MRDLTLGAAAGTPEAADRTPTVQTLSARWVLPALVLFCLLWTAYLAAVTPNAPVDNIEQLTWVRSLEWGYFKHPPLPTWLLWPLVELRGLHAHTSYLMGALIKGMTLAGFWWLMLRLRGPAHAAIALMAACCIVYYSRHLHLYNHNVVMFATVVAAAICSWQAWRLKSLRWWALLGLSLGLGMLTKYQAVVTASCVAVFFHLSGGWRDTVHRRGAVLALLVALAVFAPHLWWLQQHPINPMTYAVESSLGAGVPWSARVPAIAAWIVDHLFNRGLGALLLLVGLAWLHRQPAAQTRPVPASRGGTDAAAHLVWAFAAVPIAFIALTVLLLGAEARKHWGTAYLIWMVPAVMETLRRVNWHQVTVATAVSGFLLIQAVLVLDHQLTTVRRESDQTLARAGQPMASHWAPTVARQARFELGSAIRLVSGPETVAAAFALELPEKPVVLLESSPAISPWVNAGALGPCGSVHIGLGAPPPGARELLGGPPGLYWQVRMPSGEAECPLDPPVLSAGSGRRVAWASHRADRR